MQLVSSDSIRYNNLNKPNPLCFEPCYFCQSPVEPSKATWIEVFDGGSKATLADTIELDASDNGYMGCFPVGPSCAKRIPSTKNNPKR